MIDFPFLYGRESTLLVMARWLAFVGLGLALYRYAIMLWRAAAQVVQARRGWAPFVATVWHHIDALFIGAAFGFYVYSLFFRGPSLPSTVEELVFINLAYAGYWFATIIPRMGRRWYDPHRRRGLHKQSSGGRDGAC